MITSTGFRCLLLPLFLLCSALAFPQGKPIITVLDFKVEGVSANEMRAIISRFSTALFSTEKFTVIDITQRDTLLKEVEFSASGCSDEACMLKIGKMLAAEMIVVGNIAKVGSRYLISTRVLETQTARTVKAADGTYGSIDAMVDSLPELAGRLVGAPSGAVPMGFQAQPILGLSGLAVGVGALGVGGYLLYDAIVNGKQAIDAATAAYLASTAAESTAKWQALNVAGDAVKAKLYAGAGVAAGGLVLGALGGLLLFPPGGPTVAVAPDAGGRSVRLSATIRW